MARKKGILIISDNEPLLVMLRKMLWWLFPGVFRIDIICNPSWVIELLESVIFDIVICDLDLGISNRNGLSVLAKAKEINPVVKTVLMSGNFFILGMDGKAAGRIVGIDGFLDKPFPMETVRKTIVSLMNFSRKRRWRSERRRRSRTHR
jgi:DNA-binding NtrC family response regulator